MLLDLSLRCNAFRQPVEGGGAVAPDPPYVSAVGTHQFGLGDITLAWPTHAAGDYGWLAVESANQTVPTPSGWEIAEDSPQFGGTVGGANGYMISVFRRKAASGAEADVTITDIGDHILGVIIVVSDADPDDPIADSAGDTTTPGTNPLAMPQVTTDVANCLELHFIAPRVDLASPQISGFASADGEATEHFNQGIAAGNGGALGIYSVGKATAGLTAAATFSVTDATLPVPRIVYAIRPVQPEIVAGIFGLEFGSAFA